MQQPYIGGVDYVVCAAGAGTRFAKNGINSPKPQIVLKSKSFLEHSLDSLDLKDDDHVIVITQKSHKVASPKQLVGKINPNTKCSWLEIEGLTKGQLDTFLKAKHLLSPSRPVAIWNCDTYFNSKKLNSLIEDNTVDGIVPCGIMPGEQWSFFKVDENMVLLEAREKRRISEWASVGYYFFRDSNRLIKYAEELLSKDPEGATEHYVSLVYPLYIADGLNIKVCEVEQFRPFGSIDDVLKYWAVSIDELKAANP